MERSKHARVCVPHACVSFQESFNICENFHRICSKNEYYSRHTHTRTPNLTDPSDIIAKVLQCISFLARET